jgi:hypothetical protein
MISHVISSLLAMTDTNLRTTVYDIGQGVAGNLDMLRECVQSSKMLDARLRHVASGIRDEIESMKEAEERRKAAAKWAKPA